MRLGSSKEHVFDSLSEASKIAVKFLSAIKTNGRGTIFLKNAYCESRKLGDSNQTIRKMFYIITETKISFDFDEIRRF